MEIDTHAQLPVCPPMLPRDRLDQDIPDYEAESGDEERKQDASLKKKARRGSSKGKKEAKRNQEEERKEEEKKQRDMTNKEQLISITNDEYERLDRDICKYRAVGELTNIDMPKTTLYKLVPHVLSEIHCLVASQLLAQRAIDSLPKNVPKVYANKGLTLGLVVENR